MMLLIFRKNKNFFHLSFNKGIICLNIFLNFNLIDARALIFSWINEVNEINIFFHNLTINHHLNQLCTQIYFIHSITINIGASFSFCI